MARDSRQDQGETAELKDSEPPTKGFGDIPDGTSNTLVVGEPAAVVEPSTEAFDEADALFGRRTEVRDTEPAKAPEPEPENVEFGTPTVPPTPGGPIPVPYPTIDPSGEEEEAQQSVQLEFGHGAPTDEVDPTNSAPVLDSSAGPDPVRDDFHDPVSDALDDPFEAAEPHHAPVFEEDIGTELEIEEPADDLDVDVG